MGSIHARAARAVHAGSAARFIAGWPPGQGDVDDDQVQLRFLVDDWSGPAHVVLHQDDGVIQGTVEADNEERAIAQAARIVSLDHDGTGYAEVGERDPIVGELQKSSGYLRPVLFHSPYEAAAWSIISARTRHEQAVKIRDSLSRNGIFPAPEQLLALRAQLGLPEGKLQRLHAVAEAALEGRLDREPLLAAEPERSARAAPGAAGDRPVLRRPDPAARGRHDRRARARRAAAEEGGREALRQAAGDGGRDVAPVPDLGLGLDASACLSSTSSATSRPASRRCT